MNSSHEIPSPLEGIAGENDCEDIVSGQGTEATDKAGKMLVSITVKKAVYEYWHVTLATCLVLKFASSVAR